MHTEIDTLFDHLWQDYLAITPSAEKVHALLGAKESAKTADQQQKLENDHIALRTFGIDKISLEKLAAHFIALGYSEQGQYDFAEKKLRAKHYEHPDTKQPKVFISELIVEEMPAEVQAIIAKMTGQIPDDIATRDDFLYSGTHWQVSAQDYDTLAAHSEYAAWMSAWGFRANHFTVSLNNMQYFESLAQLNETLKEAGFILNTSGGEIKGGPEVLLAQSSTMADKIEVQFSDAKKPVPSCFYEFAQRYANASGQLYQGFVAASADKIFESTNIQ
ncbi:2-oxoadipate dioxygenase/decarboxylase family protein [Paraglaciecola aestuariivivens]